MREDIEGETSAAANQDDRLQPEVLSSVSLPLQPTSSSGSGRSTNSNNPQYKHALPLQAINPRMDLVAIVSRDVNASATATSANGAGAADPYAGLPPPPPGLSAARSQALMRMRMAQRAKALAAAGLSAPPIPANGSASGANVNAPKVSRCATIRLSLWRMSSVAGEQGARVWDVAVSVPDRFGEAEGDLKELEDVSVDAQCWSPDGMYFAVAVTLTRRLVGQGEQQRRERFVNLYALQDGKRIRVTPITEHESLPSHGMEWRPLESVPHFLTPGTAEHVLSLFGPLADINAVREDQEGKARQRQRMFQALRDHNRSKPQEDKKASELIATEARGLGKALVEHPRGVSSEQRTADTPASPSILYAWTEKSVHLFYEGAIYLGALKTKLPSPIGTVHFSVKDGALHLAGVRQNDATDIHNSTQETHLCASSHMYKGLRHLAGLSGQSFDLLTYCYDAIVALRASYRTMHTDCFAPWNRRARLVAKRYATHLPSELMMLLCTGVANDTMLAVLLGNDTMSENDLRKMRFDTFSTFNTLEQTTTHLLSALQRLILLLEEVQGCCSWHDRFGFFFGTEASSQNATSKAKIDNILSILARMARQSMALVRTFSRSNVAWTHFYQWWIFERARQEAIRDRKSSAEVLAALNGETTYDVASLLEFLRRGFDDYDVEEALGITMDAKTRGDEVEDDDDDDVNESGAAERSRPHHSSWKNRAKNDGQGKICAADESVELDTDMNASEPWYRSRQLDQKITRTVQALREPPSMQTLFRMVGKQTPSPEDIAMLIDGQADLYSGPAAGLAGRVARHPASPITSLLSLASEAISLASPLFTKAFSRWCDNVQTATQSHEINAENLFSVEMAPNSRLVLCSRIDGLESIAGLTSDAKQKERALVRSSYLEKRDVQRTATVIDEEGVGPCLIVLQKHGQHCEFVRLSLGTERVLDMSFFSIDELILLMQTGSNQVHDKQKTRLVSLQLDRISFSSHRSPQQTLPPERLFADRSVTLNDDARCGDACMLALNRHKDVCATMDDKGHLAYWDMVLPHAAFANKSAATLLDADERMPFA